MIKKVQTTLNWIPNYLYRALKQDIIGLAGNRCPIHIYFCICDHFEPYWNNANKVTARQRIKQWINEYPKVADRFRDDDGNMLKYSFFYPEEEYTREDLDALAGFCRSGYGEVEIHLHHDNDTSDNLRHTLINYKKKLYEDHGLLSVDSKTGKVVYGFIHGNWALDNSRPDGRWCGVNNEIDILSETGCYADFTMPSAPNDTQTRKVNSIYYAVDDPNQPKSHDKGINAAVGWKGSGLLIVQGPLSLNWKRRKFGLLPRIENGGLMPSNPITMDRVRMWVSQNIHVSGAPEHVFIKVYAHGAQEESMKMFFKKMELAKLFEYIKMCAAEIGGKLHFVSARECVNIIIALSEGYKGGIVRMREYRYKGHNFKD